LGGKNNYYYDGTFRGLIYTIGSTSELDVFNINSPSVKDGYIIFTIDEFLKKFPYKVGDKVMTDDGDKADIVGMVWDNDINDVFYEIQICNDVFKYPKELLLPYKEETIEESTIRLSPEQLYGEQVIIPIPKGYEFICVDDDNQQVVFEKIKSKYPKTYKECCDILEVCTPFDLGNLGNLDDKYLFIDFIRLKRCRDAYWKLYDNWKPDFTKDDIKYSIEYIGDELLKCEIRLQNTFLCFPTEEMRDSFYNNFKSFIVSCKELF
jgi:hypothetical protein